METTKLTPLARLRDRSGLTRAAAATSLGISAEWLRVLESGKSDTTSETVAAMAALYAVDVADIVEAIRQGREDQKGAA